MHNAHHLLKIYDLDGKYVKDIPLPTPGSILGISGEPEDTEMFVSFTSFLYPESIFRYDFTNSKLTQFHASEMDFDPTGYETTQVFYSSKDGTRVPMFLTQQKDLRLNGNNATLLYGYGGFNISLTPSFSIAVLHWADTVGVYAGAIL